MRRTTVVGIDGGDGGFEALALAVRLAQGRRIGVDGTPESLEAVRWAGALAGESHALRKLDLIHVDATSSLAAPARDGALDHFGDRHRKEAFDALKRVAGAQAPVDVTWTDAVGPVIPVLADLGTGLDLLVIGTHGRGLFGRLLHGGVAHVVAGRASCPVVAVPRAAPSL